MTTDNQLPAAHTPGPWFHNKAHRATNGTFISDETGAQIQAVCLVFRELPPKNDRSGREEANARLIAASPEMFAALKALIAAKEAAENDECYSLNEGLHQNAIEDAFQEAKAAIAKATQP